MVGAGSKLDANQKQWEDLADSKYKFKTLLIFLFLIYPPFKLM